MLIYSCSDFVISLSVLIPSTFRFKGTPGLLENMLILALNDILVSDGSEYAVSERIVRGVGARLFDSRLSMVTLVRTCLSCASETAIPLLIPSISKLNQVKCFLTLIRFVSSCKFNVGVCDTFFLQIFSIC